MVQSYRHLLKRYHGCWPGGRIGLQVQENLVDGLDGLTVRWCIATYARAAQISTISAQAWRHTFKLRAYGSWAGG